MNSKCEPINAVAAVRSKKRVVVSSGGGQLLSVPRKGIIIAYSVVFLEEISGMNSKCEPINAVAAVRCEERIVISSCGSQLLAVPCDSIIVADSVVFLEEECWVNCQSNPINAVAAA